jgi:surface antigen
VRKITFTHKIFSFLLHHFSQITDAKTNEEHCISNLLPSISSLFKSRGSVKPKIRLRKRTKKRLFRVVLVASNLVVLGGVSAFIIHNSSSNTNAIPSQSYAITESTVVNPLDQLSSADIAAHVAQLASLYEKQSVINNADTVNAQLSIVPADDKVISKPQLVTTDVKSHIDITNYVVKAGESMTQIAEKFGMSSNIVNEGDELTIPPINGIVHEVKDGDTAESLAQKYNSDASKIISFNDAEVAGLAVGRKIVIPDAIQPVTTYQSTTASVYSTGGFAWGGYAPIYGGNGYDYGYCTWYAAIRRAQIGRPIPSNLGNASTWRVLAERAGLATGSQPATGAVLWVPPTDYYGHVGFVEEVYPDGSIRVSDMNLAGWGVRSERTLTASEATAYNYIY